MRPIAFIFPITTAVIFFQAVTGAATVLAFYDFNLHMDTGYLVGVLALASAAVAFGRKPKYNTLRYASLVLFVLVVLQGLIGFMAETSDEIVVVHFTNALLVYGSAIATLIYSLRWGKMGTAPAPPSQT